VPVFSTLQRQRTKRFRSKRLKKAIAAKLRLWRKYSRNRSMFNRNRYNNAAKCYRKILAEEQTSREERFIVSADITAFYKYISNKPSGKTAIGPLFDASQSCRVFNDQEKAEALNNYFTSICISDDPISLTSVLCKIFEGIIKWRSINSCQPCSSLITHNMASFRVNLPPRICYSRSMTGQ